MKLLTAGVIAAGHCCPLAGTVTLLHPSSRRSTLTAGTLGGSDHSMIQATKGPEVTAHLDVGVTTQSQTYQIKNITNNPNATSHLMKIYGYKQFSPLFPFSVMENCSRILGNFPFHYFIDKTYHLFTSRIMYFTHS